jgi:hypothetical protein
MRGIETISSYCCFLSLNSSGLIFWDGGSTIIVHRGQHAGLLAGLVTRIVVFFLSTEQGSLLLKVYLSVRLVYLDLILMCTTDFCCERKYYLIM